MKVLLFYGHMAFLMAFDPDWCGRDETGMIGTVG